MAVSEKGHLTRIEQQNVNQMGY